MSTIVEKVAAGTGSYVDDRLGSSNFVSRSLRKVFPDHWSFMLGEIALYSFVILLLTGTFLTFFYEPSMAEVVYDGSYAPLRGLEMTQAYESSLEISFDVRGGLIMRQIHHWAALIFVASIVVHLLRVFFTGAFRKPREFNWIIGVVLLMLSIVEGFIGYGLPDDLLSGTGLRITSGIMFGAPVIGTWMSFFLFGGEFPGTEWVARFYVIHILLLPAIFLGLIAAHLMMVWYQKHTQYPGPGRTEDNVVGFPMMPVYIAKAGGFFFLVFGVTALISGFFTINPIWAYGPYNPSAVTAGSQPDWYMGWLEGSTRLMPGIETTIFGHTIAWNLIIPSMVLPGLIVSAMIFYPFIEQWATGDKREHHLLDRPRNAPVRTGLGVMAISFYGLLWLGGGNDIIATTFNLSLNSITWTLRIALFTVPPLAFVITKRICMGLQRRDRDRVLHGRETGMVMRTPDGGTYEQHEPITPQERWTLTQHESPRAIAAEGGTDANGVPRPGGRVRKIRAKISNFYFGEKVEPVTPQEAHEIQATHGEGH